MNELTKTRETDRGLYKLIKASIEESIAEYNRISGPEHIGASASIGQGNESFVSFSEVFTTLDAVMADERNIAYIGKFNPKLKEMMHSLVVATYLVHEKNHACREIVSLTDFIELYKAELEERYAVLRGNVSGDKSSVSKDNSENFPWVKGTDECFLS